MRKPKVMIGEAIQRVLAKQSARLAISSLADLKRAYEAELAAHGAEIEAKADATMALRREMLRDARQSKLAQILRCIECGSAMEPKRSNRLFCSARCRQRAYCQRLTAAATPP